MPSTASRQRRSQLSPKYTYGVWLRAEEKPALDRLLASYPASPSAAQLFRTLLFEAVARLDDVAASDRVASPGL